MLRVDNVPWYLSPFFLLFGYGIGILFYIYILFMRATCKITFAGHALSADRPAIYCIWHTNLVPYFIVFPKVKKQVWMNHPAWYMKPVHVLLKLTGVEHICLGSSGNQGKLALANVIEYLKQGYSTAIASDGPAGPAQELKPGALLMSRDSKIPVIPIRFSFGRSRRLGGWDQKFLPGLFSEIIVNVGEPILVTDLNFDSAILAITNHLGRV